MASMPQDDGSGRPGSDIQYFWDVAHLDLVAAIPYAVELAHCSGPALAQGEKKARKEIAISGLRCCRCFILREEEDE